MAIILKCGCKHDFQDKTYGNGMRVANQLLKKEYFRCTVCGKELKVQQNILG